MSGRCCPDCGLGCEVAGLVLGQVVGEGDDWAGQPFGPEGVNADAFAFWGATGCCDRCPDCPICQGD